MPLYTPATGFSPYDVLPDCDIDCRKEDFDTGCRTDQACGEFCISGLRTAFSCACTCDQIFVHGDSQGAEPTEQQFDSGPWCYCSNADNHQSIPPTTIVTKLTIGWNMSLIPPEQHPLALSAIGCPENPGFTFEFFQSNDLIPCPQVIETSPGVFAPGIEGVPGVGLITNPSDEDSVYVDYFPQLHPGEDSIYDCHCDLPQFFLCRIKDLCGNLMALCVLPWTPICVITCPECVPGPCCMVAVNSDGTSCSACEDGQFTAIITVDFTCPTDCRTGNTGNGQILYGPTDGEPYTETFTATTNSTIVFTHVFPCSPDTNGVGFTLDFSWNDVNANCPPGTNCADDYACPPSVTLQGDIRAGNGLITP